MQRYELWQDGEELSFFLASNDGMRRLIGPSALKLWECEAASWEEAQTLKHQHLGWEPYRPFQQR